MKTLGRFGRALAFPPGWVIGVLCCFSAGALVFIFTRNMDDRLWAYGIYALSAYSLGVLCVFLWRFVPEKYRAVKRRVDSNPLGHRYMTEREFKVRVSLYISLGINCAYAAFKLAMGLYFSSLWWGAVAVYYMVLALTRFLLLRYMRAAGSGQDLYREYRQYGRCGVLLLLLHASLAGIVVQMIRKSGSQTYSEILVITMAAYTFYTVTVSIVDVVRYRKLKSPVLLASRDIRLAAALVSLLSLESAMLESFGEDEAFRVLTISLTGAAVCAIVLIMSGYMLVKATRELGKMRKDKEPEGS